MPDGHHRIPDHPQGFTHFCYTCGGHCSPMVDPAENPDRVCACCECAALHTRACWERNWAPAWYPWYRTGDDPDPVT